MNPLNRSAPPRSCTQTGVHVPILNVLDAFIDEPDASKPIRMFWTSTLGGAAKAEHGTTHVRRLTHRLAGHRNRRDGLMGIVLDSKLHLMEYADPCSQTLISLWFFGRVACAWYAMAARTGSAVFPQDGLLEIDAADIRQGRQPGDHVGHFRGQLIVCTRAKGGRQLAEFLGQPQEGRRIPPGCVLLTVQL